VVRQGYTYREIYCHLAIEIFSLINKAMKLELVLVYALISVAGSLLRRYFITAW